MKRDDTSLNSLATVEMQSVMHFLDRRSLLRLARCSRRTMQAADAELPWKSQPVYRAELDGPKKADQLARSLLRHQPAFDVRWDGSSEPASAAPARLDALCHLRIARLELSKTALPAEQWAAVCASGAFARLATLELWCVPLPSNFTAQLALHAPLLSRLKAHLCLPGEGALSQLPRLPQLTAVDLHLEPTEWREADASLSQLLAACPRLSTLKLEDGGIGAGFFKRVFYSSSAATLQRIALGNPHPSLLEGVTEAEWAAGFASLSQLRELILKWPQSCLDALLPHLAHAPQLQLLSLHVSTPAGLLSADLLRSLLDAAPQLRVHLQVHQPDTGSHVYWELHTYGRLRFTHPERFTMELDDD